MTQIFGGYPRMRGVTRQLLGRTVGEAPTVGPDRPSGRPGSPVTAGAPS